MNSSLLDIVGFIIFLALIISASIALIALYRFLVAWIKRRTRVGAKLFVAAVGIMLVIGWGYLAAVLFSYGLR